jgi:hypothetical protein
LGDCDPHSFAWLIAVLARFEGDSVDLAAPAAAGKHLIEPGAIASTFQGAVPRRALSAIAHGEMLPLSADRAAAGGK